MNYKSHEHNSHFQKIEPFRKNISQKCQCHCHNKIGNIKKPNNLFLLDEKNINSNLNQRPKLNVIKTETNTNLIKSYVIYKNQIKPLFFSKVAKNNRKNVSNLKKYSYGGKQLKIATNTNNHSFKEIIGRSCSKNKEFKKSRVINYRTEYNSYNFDYSCNNKNNNNYKNEKNNINIVKDIQVNNDKIKKSSSENDLYIKTNTIINNRTETENKYEKFITDLNNKLNINLKLENFPRKKTENNINNKYIYNNFMNNLYNNKFRYYYDYKKNLLERKNNLVKSNSNSYMIIKKTYPVNRINSKYEDLKLKIKLNLLRNCRYINENNENKKNNMDMKYILLEKTKKILEEKNKRNNNIKNQEKDIIDKKNVQNNTIKKIKNFLNSNTINNNDNMTRIKNNFSRDKNKVN